jgi:hypothetical protein
MPKVLPVRADTARLHTYAVRPTALHLDDTQVLRGETKAIRVGQRLGQCDRLDRGESSAAYVEHQNMQDGTGSSTSMSATRLSDRRRVAPIQRPKLNLF